jgi:hypothetical protein
MVHGKEGRKQKQCAVNLPAPVDAASGIRVMPTVSLSSTNFAAIAEAKTAAAAVTTTVMTAAGHGHASRRRGAMPRPGENELRNRNGQKRLGRGSEEEQNHRPTAHL